MPKAAAQRLTPAQINSAHQSGIPVAVSTGFKRGFTMDARPAIIVENKVIRTVFASDDPFGRDIADGVGVIFQDGGTPRSGDFATVVVAPSDVLDVWSHYVTERDEVAAAREAARAAAAAQRAHTDQLADELGGTVMLTPAGVLGVFLPYAAAAELGGTP